MPANEDQLRQFILAHVASLAKEKGIALPSMSDEVNLLDMGVLDSLGFIELLLLLQERFGIELQLAELDPAEFSTLKGMVAVAAMAS